MTKNYNLNIMEWEAFPKYDMIWTDPPWEQRMLNYFNTVMERDSEAQATPHTIDEILNQLGRLADPSKALIIEYSIKGHKRVIDIMESHGHKHCAIYERRYDGGRPFLVMTFNVDIDLAETDDEKKLIVDTLKEIPPCVVFDPFAGIGFTAKHVRQAGHEYIGSEMNPARFKKLCEVNV